MRIIIYLLAFFISQISNAQVYQHIITSNNINNNIKAEENTQLNQNVIIGNNVGYNNQGNQNVIIGHSIGYNTKADETSDDNKRINTILGSRTYSYGGAYKEKQIYNHAAYDWTTGLLLTTKPVEYIYQDTEHFSFAGEPEIFICKDNSIRKWVSVNANGKMVNVFFGDEIYDFFISTAEISTESGQQVYLYQTTTSKLRIVFDSAKHVVEATFTAWNYGEQPKILFTIKNI